MQPSFPARQGRAISLLVCALFLSFSATFSASGGPTGIAVLGDSLSDEYRDAEFFPPGGRRTLARNYAEILASTHHANFGSYAADWGDIRQKGYAYNWAQDGDRSDDALAHGQHTGIAAEAGAGNVDLAWLSIGGNDFRDLYDPAVIGSPDPAAAITDKITKLGTNVGVIVQKLLTSSPTLNLVLGNIPDLRSTPALKFAIAQTPALVQWAAAVDQGIQAFNAQLAGIAAGNSRVAVADLYALSQPAVAGQTVAVGSLLLDTNVPGQSPEHYFVDAIHPGTAAQGLLANLFVEASNAKFNSGVAPLSEQEIAAFASALPVPLPVPLLGGLSLLPMAWAAARRRVGVA